MSKVYFPNLNSLRALAAIIVVVSHIESNKVEFGLKINTSIIGWGAIGVSLFFVLSGYLITYLLLIEKSKFYKINIKDFYLRRILRIWPLYFLILFIVYFSIPYILPEYYLKDTSKFSINSIFLNVFFLTNIAAVVNLTPEIIGTIWSIGIEEQFYVYWPWVMKIDKQKSIFYIVSIIFLFPIIKMALLIDIKLIGNDTLMPIYNLLNYTRFDTMAIGGLFAMIGFYKEIDVVKLKLKYNMFTSKKLQFSIYVLIFILFLTPINNSFIKNIINLQVLPLLFSICILNLSTNQNSIINIENKNINYLGKISYSLYLNHLVVIFLFFPILKPMINNFSPFYKNLIIFPSTLILVIIISHITYNGYEKQFLKYKKKFSHIKT